MNLRIIIFSCLVLAATGLLIGCGGSPEGGNTANSKPVNGGTQNANGVNAESKDPTAVTTPTPDQITNNAPTLTPVYKAYCAAVVKKDEAAIRKFYTADTLKTFEENMKEDGIKTLSEYLKDDKVSLDVCQISNEQIKGDKAVARVRPSDSYPVGGFAVLFIKEGGEWKMSNIAPDKGFN